ncbi:MAG: peptidoglycan editing factor PgeF [Pseudomonadota bacterium]
MTAPPFETSEGLTAAGARHGFFGRRGGVSATPYDSLNTGPGSNDSPGSVEENRRRCADAIGVEQDHLLTLYQCHSDRVVVVDGPWNGAPPEADALVTTTSGLALGALAADCMPVILFEPGAGVAGAAHAGWRGALAGVLENTVEAMTELGASPAAIVAGIGPCLRQPNFEVGFDLIDAFVEKYPQAEKFFGPAAAVEKRLFDLVAFAIWRLEAAGVSAVDVVGGCTLGERDRYFSHRGARRDGAPDYGRNLSTIALL